MTHRVCERGHFVSRRQSVCQVCGGVPAEGRKVSLALPPSINDEIDRISLERGVSKSAIIVEAIRNGGTREEALLSPKASAALELVAARRGVSKTAILEAALKRYTAPRDGKK